MNQATQVDEMKPVKPGQCFNHCEQLKCASLFTKPDDWMTWYQCVQGCTHRCYTIVAP